MMKELVSIITVSYNSALTIRDTINSVNNQKYSNIEHIFIDGKSSDSTLYLINKFSERNPVIISENDNGIYDAMNKGIKKCSGEFIFILNSDDKFFNDEVVIKIVSLFSKSKADVIYGGMIVSNSKSFDIIKRKWLPTEFKFNSYRNGWHTPHPGFVVRRKVYDNMKSLLHTDLMIASDFELMLRIMENTENKSVMYPDYVAIVKDGGVSSNIKGIFMGFNNIKKAFERNKIKVNFLLYFSKRYFKKIIQKFKK